MLSMVLCCQHWLKEIINSLLMQFRLHKEMLVIKIARSQTCYRVKYVRR